MTGPPGTGKSMLAQRLPGILPPMAEGEAIESAALLSLVGKFKPKCSVPGRCGRRTTPPVRWRWWRWQRPASWRNFTAHHGVLFLDEVVEFDRWYRGTARTTGKPRNQYSRAARQVTFESLSVDRRHEPLPGRLSGANPWRPCRCTPDQIARYRGQTVRAAA